MSVAGFIGVALLIYGVFITALFGRELRNNLRSETVQATDGTWVDKSHDARRYWRNIYAYAFLCLWGVGWAIWGSMQLL